MAPWDISTEMLVWGARHGFAGTIRVPLDKAGILG
jgi:hypothetical protein